MTNFLYYRNRGSLILGFDYITDSSMLTGPLVGSDTIVDVSSITSP